MRHLHVISRAQLPTVTGITNPYAGLDTLIIYGLTLAFNSWDNFTVVIRNLEKFYQKI